MDTTALPHHSGYTGKRQECNTAFPSRCLGGGLLCVLALLLTACSTAVTSSAAPAMQTAAAQATQATQTAALVTVVVAVRVRGSLAHHDVVVTVTSTITNHTDARIHLAGTCEQPDVMVTIKNPSGGEAYRTNEGVNCILMELADYPSPIAASASQIHVETVLLSRDAVQPLTPGLYSVLATVTAWHQGTLDQVAVDPRIPGGAVTSNLVWITLS